MNKAKNKNRCKINCKCSSEQYTVQMNKKSHNPHLFQDKNVTIKGIAFNFYEYFTNKLLGKFKHPIPLRVEQQEFRF